MLAVVACASVCWHGTCKSSVALKGSIMNTAAAIYKNLATTMSRESGSRGKAASETDNSQQRFSAILPLAQAAQEQASGVQTPEKTPRDAPGTIVEDTVAPALEEETSSQEKEADVTYSQVAGWPFVELIAPTVQPQFQETVAGVQAVDATKGEDTTESAAFGAEGVAQASSAAWPDVETADAAVPIAQTSHANGMGRPQVASVQEPPVKSSREANIVTDVAIPDEQGVATTATDADEQVPAVPDISQKTTPTFTPAAATTLSHDVQMEQHDVQGESTRNSSGPETAGVVARQGAQDVATSLAEGADGPSEGQAEVEYASVKTQPANSQANAESASRSKSQAGTHDYGSAARNPDDGMLESEAAVTEGAKISVDPAEGKNAPTAALKETGTEGTTTPELRVSTVGETSVSSHRVGSQTQSQTTAHASSPQTPAQSVGEQILDSVRASMANGDRQVSIRLLPPELGTVVVRFQERGEQLTGVVEVANSDTRREVERALPQVVRSLQEAGVQVRRVEVVTADQPDNRNMGGENLPQDVWQQHQGTGQNREHTYASQQTRWSQNLGGRSVGRQAGSGEPSRAAAAQGQIDLLL
jgi:flagellar hook-length control protein FliK